MFVMNLTTTFKFKLFKAGVEYSEDLVPSEVLELWERRGIAMFVTKPKRVKRKKNDNKPI